MHARMRNGATKKYSNTMVSQVFAALVILYG